MELPVRFGGLGISNPVKAAKSEFINSVNLTKDLTNQIYEQSITERVDISQIQHKKSLIESAKNKEYEHALKEILEDPHLPSHQKKLLELAQEKGVGAWLTALPIKSLGFAFNKEDFRGSICIRYGWRIANMPLHCACGVKNDIDHSLSCKLGGYVSFRHDSKDSQRSL